MKKNTLGAQREKDIKDIKLGKMRILKRKIT